MSRFEGRSYFFDKNSILQNYYMRRVFQKLNPVIDNFIKIHFLQKSAPFPNAHFEVKYQHLVKTLSNRKMHVLKPCYLLFKEVCWWGHMTIITQMHEILPELKVFTFKKKCKYV